MVDFFYKPVIPERCPDCKGQGRMPYPYCYYPCSRCEGTGLIVHLTLTYPEYVNSGGQPGGRTMFAGIIERPYRGDDF
ncbi:hypothetical protein ES703_106054 [subsurface metagenome]